jgi:hypothetical protein
MPENNSFQPDWINRDEPRLTPYEHEQTAPPQRYIPHLNLPRFDPAIADIAIKSGGA